METNDATTTADTLRRIQRARPARTGALRRPRNFRQEAREQKSEEDQQDRLYADLYYKGYHEGYEAGYYDAEHNRRRVREGRHDDLRWRGRKSKSWYWL